MASSHGRKGSSPSGDEVNPLTDEKDYLCPTPYSDFPNPSRISSVEEPIPHSGSKSRARPGLSAITRQVVRTCPSVYKFACMLVFAYSLFWFLPNRNSILERIQNHSTNSFGDLGVDHIYILTVNPERAGNMSLMLNSIGAQYEIFWGPDAWTDWFNTTVAEIDSRGYLGEFESNSYGPDRSRLRWKLACLVGHQNIWRDAMEKRYRRFLILEDDVDMHANIGAIMRHSWKQVPEDWDALMLGSCTPTYNETIAIGDGSVGRIDRAWCGHAYVANQRGASKMLQYTDGFPNTFDATVFVGKTMEGMFKLYAIRDAIVQQLGSVPSVIIGKPYKPLTEGSFGRNGLAYSARAWDYAQRNDVVH